MRKQILSAVSAVAILAGTSFAWADTERQDPAATTPETQAETTTEDLGVQEETEATESAPGTGMTADPAAPAAPDTTTTGETTTMPPVSLSALRPLDGETDGVTVEGLPADDVIGGHLVNAEGERIATVNNLLVDSAGEPQGILAGFGGFLGFMQKEVAVPLDRVQLVRGDDGEFPTDLTEDEIEAMPEYEEPDA